MKKFLTLLTLMTLIAFGAQAQKQVYTVFNNGTLTYYYDDQMDTRQGIKEVYEKNKRHFDDYYQEVKIAVIDASMQQAKLTSTAYMFCTLLGGSSSYNSGLENMTTIIGIENLNTADVTDMEYMFHGCNDLQSLDLRSFNLDKVESVYHMFSECSNLTTIYCDEDMSAKTGLDSEKMFVDCTSLVGGGGTKYDKDNIDAAYARPDGLGYMKGYFTGTMPVYTVCNSGTLTYYCDYKMDSRLGITEVYDPAAKRFEGYNEMVTRAVIDPSMAKAQLTSLHYMFYSEEGSYFGNLPNLTTITGLEYLNTANVTDMSGMFTGCWALTDPLNLSNFNTANVTNMNFMFGGCSELTELDLTAFDVDKVTSMDYMFTNCKKLKTIYCETDWTTGAVTSSTNMFDNCKVIQGDNGTKWAAGNPKDISYARPDGGTENPGYFSQKPTEGIENIQPSVISTQKFLRDGQLLIERDGKTYTITGQKVR